MTGKGFNCFVTMIMENSELSNNCYQLIQLLKLDFQSRRMLRSITQAFQKKQLI